MYLCMIMLYVIKSDYVVSFSVLGSNVENPSSPSNAYTPHSSLGLGTSVDSLGATSTAWLTLTPGS